MFKITHFYKHSISDTFLQTFNIRHAFRFKKLIDMRTSLRHFTRKRTIFAIEKLK